MNCPSPNGVKGYYMRYVSLMVLLCACSATTQQTNPAKIQDSRATQSSPAAQATVSEYDLMQQAEAVKRQNLESAQLALVAREQHLQLRKQQAAKAKTECYDSNNIYWVSNGETVQAASINFVIDELENHLISLDDARKRAFSGDDLMIQVKGSYTGLASFKGGDVWYTLPEDVPVSDLYEGAWLSTWVRYWVIVGKKQYTTDLGVPRKVYEIKPAHIEPEVCQTRSVY